MNSFFLACSRFKPTSSSSSSNCCTQVPEKRPELEAKASDSSATGGPNEINYAQLFEEELLKVDYHFLNSVSLCPRKQGTSKKKVLDQPDGMVVQAVLNVTMPGSSH